MATIQKYNVELETDALSKKKVWKLIELLIEAGYSVYGNFEEDVVGFEILANNVVGCSVLTESPATNDGELQ